MLAIVGPGNIGTDLMFKLMRRSQALEPRYMIGVDPTSDGLRRAAAIGLEAQPGGRRLVARTGSAARHRVRRHLGQGAPGQRAPVRRGRDHGGGPHPCRGRPVHLPAGQPALQPRRDERQHGHLCGPGHDPTIVKAVSSVVEVPYAEICASISSKSAGPGTRANIDEFTETTSEALQVVGGAKRGKAIIILNPADPPILMRNTVFCADPSGGAPRSGELAGPAQRVDPRDGGQDPGLRARLPPARRTSVRPPS